ncbi:fluoride efflux transporter FluC [Streptomyces sp. NPDC002889]|uniref:fluoride efflux transporter FluC n=1 Tax=Streptomyces sp. NPDC002889 TaxID=3364669 RepID=UPI003680D464
MSWLLVIAGAAAGAPLRYLTDRAVQARHECVFPWGTFVVNAAGSLMLGALAGASVSSGTYALLGTGLCGALTTYSTFSYETLRLAESGRTFLAAVNVGGSLLVGFGSVYLGGELARGLVG